VGLRRFLRRARWDQERARELEVHLAIEVDENVARGMSPADARSAARRKLGNVTLIREEIYNMNTLAFLDGAWQDLRYGARLLRLNRRFATVAILSLALGVGANTAIFQLLDAVRLRSLPVRNPHELVEVLIEHTDGGRTGNFMGRHVQLTQPVWERIRADQRVFSEMLAWGFGRFNLASGGEARMSDGLWVSGDYFSTLGVQPLAGRLFTAADDQPGCGSPGAVISYPFWQRAYGGAPSAIGRTATLNGHPFEIIGVTPASFFGMEMGRSFDIAVPVCAEPIIRGAADSGIGKSDVWWMAVVGRLRPDVSRAQADAQLRAISPAIFKDTLPKNYTADDVKHYLSFRLHTLPATSGVASLTEYDTPMWVLLAMTSLVLLISCANLANLMLARASAREREIAVRLAMGASRARVVRQLVAESLLLAAIGAASGAWLAQSLSRFLVGFLSTERDTVFVTLAIDWRVLAFTAGLAVLTCLLFGLAPALRATEIAPAASIKSAGRGMTDGRERFGLRRALVIAQVALSLVLVVGALLFVRSLRNLVNVDAGFRPDGLLVVDVDFERMHVPIERRPSIYDDLMTRVQHTPGVESATELYIVPVSGGGWNDTIVTDGLNGRKPTVVSNFNRVTPGFFRTMATPFLAGRDFSEHDRLGGPAVAIVTEAFARDVLHEANPVGRRVETASRGDQPRAVYEIIGVVRDMKYQTLRERFKPILFLPMQQDPELPTDPSMIVRSTLPLAESTTQVAAAIRSVSPDITISFTALPAQIRASLLRERLMATLSGFFGALAALIATIGLYGVMSYTVARRRNEFGIRLALGADRRDIVRMVMREAGALLIAGVTVGTLLAIAGARTASTLFFGLQPGDPVTLALAAVGLGAVALVASYVPAVRASRLEPTEALRAE
jgi:predicted permease